MSHTCRQMIVGNDTKIHRGCRWILHSCALLLVVAGCRGAASSRQSMDSTLERHVRNASDAFREGQIERSTSEYRRALHRAWAMDDPYESGAGAYNLAASLLSASQTDQAKDWLLDARVEFQRAGSSAGNVWLLEAKIAQQESRLDDVTYLIQRASCSAPPALPARIVLLVMTSHAVSVASRRSPFWVRKCKRSGRHAIAKNPTRSRFTWLVLDWRPSNTTSAS